MSYQVLRSEILFRGKVFEVQRDQVRMPDGRMSSLDLVIHQPAVTLLPIDDQGNIWFVRQYRHPVGKEILELPAGVVEPGETPENCARREIREEIGMGARSIRELGAFYLAPGYSTEYMHVYLAQDLYPAPLTGDVDEFIRVEKVPIDQVMRLVEETQIQDAKSLASLLLARALLG